MNKSISFGFSSILLDADCNEQAQNSIKLQPEQSYV